MRMYMYMFIHMHAACTSYMGSMNQSPTLYMKFYTDSIYVICVSILDSHVKLVILHAHTLASRETFF